MSKQGLKKLNRRNFLKGAAYSSALSVAITISSVNVANSIPKVAGISKLSE